MLRRMLSCVLVAAFLFAMGLAVGCQPEPKSKVEHHEDVSVSETVDRKIAVE